METINYQAGGVGDAAQARPAPHSWLILTTYLLECCCGWIGWEFFINLIGAGLFGMDGQRVPTSAEIYLFLLGAGFFGSLLVPFAMAIYLATRKNWVDRLGGWPILLINGGCLAAIGYGLLLRCLDVLPTVVKHL